MRRAGNGRSGKRGGHRDRQNQNGANDAVKSSVLNALAESAIIDGKDSATLLYEARASADNVEKELAVTHRSPAKELRAHLTFVKEQLERTKVRLDLVNRATDAFKREWEARNEILVVELEAYVNRLESRKRRSARMLATAKDHLVRQRDTALQIKQLHAEEISAAKDVSRGLAMGLTGTPIEDVNPPPPRRPKNGKGGDARDNVNNGGGNTAGNGIHGSGSGSGSGGGGGGGGHAVGSPRADRVGGGPGSHLVTPKAAGVGSPRDKAGDAAADTFGAPTTNVVSLVHVDVPDADALRKLRPRAWTMTVRVLMGLLRERLRFVQGGYEVRRGMDSFIAAFRDPEEAVKWCFDVQERLLDAEWPLAILHTSMTKEISEQRAMHGTKRGKIRKYVLFRGPRVRMACVSGLQEIYQDPYTDRVMYRGGQHARLVAIATSARPGQIVVDDAAAMIVQEKAEEWGFASVVELGTFETGLSRAETLHSVLPASLTGRERGFPPLGEPDEGPWTDPDEAAAGSSSAGGYESVGLQRSSHGRSSASLSMSRSRRSLLGSRTDLRQLTTPRQRAQAEAEEAAANAAEAAVAEARATASTGGVVDGIGGGADAHSEAGVSAGGADGTGTEGGGGEGEGGGGDKGDNGDDGDSGDNGGEGADGDDDAASLASQIPPYVPPAGFDGEHADGDEGTRFTHQSLVEHDAVFLQDLDANVADAEVLVRNLKGLVDKDQRAINSLRHMIMEFRTNPAGLLDFMRNQIRTHENNVWGLVSARDSAKQSVENIIAHMDAIRRRWFDDICPKANRIPGLQREIIELIREKRNARERINDERAFYLGEVHNLTARMAFCDVDRSKIDGALDNIWLWMEHRLLTQLGYLI